MQSSLNPTLIQVLNEYEILAENIKDSRNWADLSEEELWKELCRCILSSNVPYELAISALSHLVNKGFLKLNWVAGDPNSQHMIANELSKPLYLPLKLDGTLRKYRFPNVRSRDITKAAKIIFSEESWLQNLLARQNSEKRVREILARTIPGVGLKEASHFLRDIGYSSNLAIIDTHVVAFLREINVLPSREIRTINREIYFELESFLEELCKKHNVNLSLFDMAIWSYMRKRY
jgi:N-glycosylase/DNA lyase